MSNENSIYIYIYISFKFFVYFRLFNIFFLIKHIYYTRYTTRDVEMKYQRVRQEDEMLLRAVTMPYKL